MELLKHPSDLVNAFAPQFVEAPFTLIDVGCSGGIDPNWRIFEPNLRAFGFDPNISECERLNANEKNPHVRYVPSFVGIEDDHPFRKMRGEQSFWERNPWNRLSVARTTALQAELRKSMTTEQLTERNLWNETRLADSSKPVILGRFLSECGIASVDFLKIDVDGSDFDILNSLDKYFDSLGILGVVMEVNWHGSDNPVTHVFHNTDRFLRAMGFELFDITMRRYSIAALPAPYAITIPAQTIKGRPLQGDALYLRDLAAPEFAGLASRMDPHKLMKAAILFEMAGMPDGAAEILCTFQSRLGGKAAVTPMLDRLTTKAGADFGHLVSYADYIDRFEKDDAHFYPKR